MKSFFHCCSIDADPAELLDSEQHFTEPWGSAGHGRCDKCAAPGRPTIAASPAWSADASRNALPAGAGSSSSAPALPVRAAARSNRTRRRGIAVFPSREGLYRYLVERDAELGGKVIVEIAGQPSEDLDLDADCGALLVFPEQIREVRPLDLDLAASVRRRLDGASSSEV